MLEVKITGYNGYLGQLIANELSSKNYRVSGINRNLLFTENEQIKRELKNIDVVINLAGAPILQRWTAANKKQIYDSRIVSTRNLVSAIHQLEPDERPKQFISASAVGIYNPGKIHDESSTDFDSGFVGQVVKDWEAASEDLPADVQRVIFRIGIVLGKEAKSVKKLILPTKSGLAATLGNGKQAFPFIHEKDLVRAFLFVLSSYPKNEIFNLVAPDQIDNKTFTRLFAKQLNRPSLFSIPSFFLKAALGEAATLLTEGAQVIPRKLQRAGFRFKYPTINETLHNILP